MHVVELVGVTALRSRDACHLCLHLCLDDYAANVVGLLLGLAMVATWSALIGLPVGISVGTFRIGACSCMECMIHLLSMVWSMGMSADACTLGTCCTLQI
jgi:hypothetical protein